MATRSYACCNAYTTISVLEFQNVTTMRRSILLHRIQHLDKHLVVQRLLTRKLVQARVDGTSEDAAPSEGSSEHASGNKAEAASKSLSRAEKNKAKEAEKAQKIKKKKKAAQGAMSKSLNKKNVGVLSFGDGDDDDF
eukprot:m.153420 g.153420  ORF g.153420 m.153420 type:complete len:137 (+) comp17912_c0_seq2:122-532(+)